MNLNTMNKLMVVILLGGCFLFNSLSFVLFTIIMLLTVTYFNYKNYQMTRYFKIFLIILSMIALGSGAKNYQYSMITGYAQNRQTYQLIVLNSDSATRLYDLSRSTFGYRDHKENYQNFDDIIASIDFKISQHITPVVYETDKEMVQSFMAGEVRVLLIEKKALEEYEKVHPGFSDNIKILYAYVK